MNSSRRCLLTAATATVTAGAGCTSLLEGKSENGTDGGDGTSETNERTSGYGTDVPADNWPSFQRTPQNAGYTPATAPTDDPTERWSTTLSGGIGDQVAVVDGVIYTATDDGTVHALEASSGDEIWTESLEGGRSQCPCVVDGLVVVVGTETGDLVALNATDGSREWTTELAGPVAGPTAVDGTVYVGTSGEPTAHAIDATDGDEVWSAPLAVGAVGYPAVDGDGVYVGGQDGWDGHVHALEPSDGTEQWTYEGTRMQPPTVAGEHVLAPASTIEVLPPDSSHRQIAITGQILASPAATPETVVYGTEDGRVGSIEHETFDGGWNVSVGDLSVLAPAVTDEAVYVTAIGPELVSLDLETGEQRWKRSLESGVPTGPTVADGAVFVGTDAGRLFALE